MIRLRDTIERGCSHPVLGPLVVLLLLLLLAAVLLHVVMEGADVAMAFGQLCVAMIVLLGPLVLARPSRVAPAERSIPTVVRGPPALRFPRLSGFLDGLSASAVTPLRR